MADFSVKARPNPHPDKYRMEVVNIWVAVPDMIGVEVNSHGQVRGSITQPYCGPDGYMRAYHDGRLHLVHRLVCRAIHGPAPAGKALVLHYNDIKDDNRAENLRWGNASENMADAVRNGIAIGPKAWRR
ncbi:HNH endonuclease signature motif containing protein [Sphingobium yanoikuyae]|uniref:HNH endonuclease signature motif containing protein n=1 Tax=Sphingobium yanoikuyae TaxID=13690 RepID=UPI0035C858D1